MAPAASWFCPWCDQLSLTARLRVAAQQGLRPQAYRQRDKRGRKVGPVLAGLTSRVVTAKGSDVAIPELYCHRCGYREVL